MRTKADADATPAHSAEGRRKVKITDTTKGQWRLIVRDGKGRWVKKKFLATKKPDLPAADGAHLQRALHERHAVESGLTPDAIKVHRALCARYPAGHRVRRGPAGRRRRARLRPSGRRHDLRLHGRLGDRQVGARQRASGSVSARSSTPSTSGPSSAAARAGAACPIVARPPPTTTTTFTSRCTATPPADLGSPLGVGRHAGEDPRCGWKVARNRAIFRDPPLRLVWDRWST